MYDSEVSYEVFEEAEEEVSEAMCGWVAEIATHKAEMTAHLASISILYWKNVVDVRVTGSLMMASDA